MADNWLSDIWEWLVPGEDDQGIFKNIFGGDDETEYEDISSFDDSLLDASGDYLGYDPNTGSIDDWLQSILPTEDMDWMDDLGFSFGDWEADDYPDPFQGTGTRETWGGEDLPDTGIFSGDRFPGLADFFNSLFGGANRAVGTVGGGIGDLLNSPLAQLAMLNYMKNKNKDVMDIPVGWGDGGGGGGGDGSPIDYRTFNLQPALMPGVAYANVGTQPPTPPPPGMEHGGLGDVTLAKLEPGEFVVTKKAVDNIGAQNLYRMMKEAEGRG